MAQPEPTSPHRTTHWVPIRSLAPRHRDRIVRHLLELPEHDRYLRFGYVASDEQVIRYVQQIDFEHDEVLGIFNRRLRLVAMAHLAHLRGVQTLLIHALSENAPMLRIARHAGAQVVRDGGESQALLRLPADTLASQVEQIVESGAAEWDYRFKRHAQRMARLKEVLSALAQTGHPGAPAADEPLA
jgi:hypothetical protein